MSTKHHERREDRPSPPPEKGDETRATEENAVPGGERAESPGPEAAGAATPDQALREAEARILSLTEELSGLKDQYLRKLADYENFRKRMAREKEESLKYAVSTLLGDLVPVLDDFDRAVASAEHARDYVILHDGVVLIRRQLGGLLENKYGLVRFEALGRPFDPNAHEAVASDRGEVEEPVVAEEFLPGYRLHDRVLRTAKVRVRMPASPAPGGAGTAVGESAGAAAPDGDGTGA